MTDRTLNDRRKRLVYRSQHRGTKEADVLLGGFAAEHAGALSEAEVGLFEALLDEPDLDLVDWILRRNPVPDRHSHALMKRIIDFNTSKRPID